MSDHEIVLLALAAYAAHYDRAQDAAYASQSCSKDREFNMRQAELAAQYKATAKDIRAVHARLLAKGAV